MLPHRRRAPHATYTSALETICSPALPQVAHVFSLARPASAIASSMAWRLGCRDRAATRYPPTCGVTVAGRG